jgi:hypothetical protein
VNKGSEDVGVPRIQKGANDLTVRYSPKPITAYGRRAGGAELGPAYSSFLRNDEEAWNLAWLSHDYENRSEHSDPQFTVLVNKSVNMVRASGIVDYFESQDPGKTLRGLLQLPTPAAFWGRATAERLLIRTPLFAAYGARWLDLVWERSVEIPVASWIANPSQGDAEQLKRVLEKFKDAHT